MTSVGSRSLTLALPFGIKGRVTLQECGAVVRRRVRGWLRGRGRGRGRGGAEAAAGQNEEEEESEDEDDDDDEEQFESRPGADARGPAPLTAFFRPGQLLRAATLAPKPKSAAAAQAAEARAALL